MSLAIGGIACDSNGTLIASGADAGLGSVGPDAASAGSDATLEAGTLRAAQQWFSSDADPFQLNNPDLVWFTGPQPIKYMLARQKDLPITAPGGTQAMAIRVDPASPTRAFWAREFRWRREACGTSARCPPRNRRRR